jgi:hypothetical protein
MISHHITSQSLRRLLTTILFSSFFFGSTIFAQAQNCSSNLPCSCGAITEPMLTFDNVSLSTLYPNSSSVTLSNQLFRIKGKLTVDIDLTIENCCINIFGPNGAIDITNGKTMTSNCSNYQLCSGSSKWKGISVSSGKLNFDGNTVTGANVAITYSGTGFSTEGKLIKNIFLDNGIGILIQNAGTFSQKEFWGNDFSASPNFVKSNYTVTGGFTGIPYGIVVSFTPLATLFTGSVQNVYHDLWDGLGMGSTKYGTGIYATNSEIHAFGKFQNNYYGIRTLGCNTIVSTATSLFKGDFTGIFCEFPRSVSIKLCSFLDKNTDIKVNANHHLTNVKVEIIRNNFFMPKPVMLNGIKLSRTNGSGFSENTTISFNNFQILGTNDEFLAASQDLGYGMISVLNGYPNTDLMSIHDNTINVRSDAVRQHNGVIFEGASMLASQGISIIKNNITYKQLNGLWAQHPERYENLLGIAIENINEGTLLSTLHNNRIDNNTIISEIVNTTSTNEFTRHSFIKCGIHLHNSTGWSLCSNTVDGTYRGAHFGGTCTGSIVTQNKFNMHHFGILLAEGTSMATAISPQVRKLNTWLNSAGSYFNNAVEMDAVSTPLNSRFRVCPSQDDPSLLTGNSTLPPSFSPSSLVQNICNDPINTICTPSRSGSNFWNDDEIRRFNGEQIYTLAVQDWESRSHLLLKMIRNTADVNANTAAATYLTQQSGNTAWQYAIVRRQIEDAFSGDPATIAGLDVLQAEQGVFADSLSKLSITVPDSLDSGAKTAMLNTLANVKSRLNYLATGIDQKQTQLYQTRTTALQSCVSANNALPETTAYEAAQKFLQGLVLKNGLGIDWSDADKAQVLSLASGCPTQLGSAVSMAGSLLPDSLLNANKEPSYTTACSRSDAHQTTTAGTLTVSPNPASDYVRINLSGVDGEGTISVYEVSTGRLFYQSKAAGNNQSLLLDTGSWPSGTYITRLDCQQCASSFARFIITK